MSGWGLLLLLGIRGLILIPLLHKLLHRLHFFLGKGLDYCRESMGIGHYVGRGARLVLGFLTRQVGDLEAILGMDHIPDGVFFKVFLNTPGLRQA